MKNRKNRFKMSISILLIIFIITTYPLNTFNIEASINENNRTIIDSCENLPWKWTQTEVVSTEGTSSSFLPSLAIDSVGDVHIAWGDNHNYTNCGTDYDIFYRKWDASISTWTETEVVSTESTGSTWFPSLVVDITGNIHIAWEDNTNYTNCGTDYDIHYKFWNSTSSSWSITEVVSTESTEDSAVTSLDTDSAGNIHIVWDDFTNYTNCGDDSDIFYKHWNSTSSSWSITEVVSTESTENSVNPSIAIDTSGNVHIAWEDRTNYTNCGIDRDIFYKQWNTSITSWSTTEVVSTESTSSSSWPSLDVDKHGTPHIAWYDMTDYAGCGSQDDIFYKRRIVETSSWTLTEVVSTESSGSSVEACLTTDLAGNVHIIWWDETNIIGCGDDVDIFYKRWEACTSLWTGTEIVSVESTDHSEGPAIATDNAGNIHIAWEDRTNYTNCGTDLDVFYKVLNSPLYAPELLPILPNPTHEETVSLDWNNVLGASLYYIYRSTSNILSVEGLTPIGNTVTSFYIDTLPTSGTFYFVVVASNSIGNSTPSNCWSIVYLPVINEFGTISSLIFGSITFLTVIIVIRKKRSK